MGRGSLSGLRILPFWIKFDEGVNTLESGPVKDEDIM